MQRLSNTRSCSLNNSYDYVTDPVQELALRHLRCLLPLCIAVACIILSACTTSGSTVGAQVPGDNARQEGLSAADTAMVDDHLSVIEQLFDPYSTTLQITNNDTDPTLTLFASRLASGGYGIQRVTADQGANYLSYDRVTSVVEDSPIVSFVSRIGSVELSRDYEVSENNVITPVSGLRLSGTRTPVGVDSTSIANKQIDKEYSAVEYIASLRLDDQVPVISLITSDIVEQVARRATESPALSPGQPLAPSLQAINASRLEVNNLFYAETSTFNTILDSYDRIDRQVIVFGNDSLVLGETNKSLIGQFVDSRVGDRDIISLVGCSNGPTDLEIGNEGLALGRAKRVTEALLALGLNQNQVLDEGCWAPVSAGEKFPARGVVMELWRRTS
ncbi:MAG: hypothetical protein AB8B63_01175 [Granulosicoccus sp.]